MERIDRILNHPLYREQLALLQEAEKGRLFCGHTMEHLLHVARLMYIFRLERGEGPDKELIYAAALLHDIGRFEQIHLGTPHHLSGARLAGEILQDCGFTAGETARIQQAITAHRGANAPADDLLSVWLYRADKLSRSCFCCPAAALCDWPETKKNQQITY